MTTHKYILNWLLRKIFGLKESKSLEIGTPQKILLVRQHNQLGDLLASTPVLTAFKEKYPNVHLTVITGPQNYKAYKNNPFIDKFFVFDKRNLFDRVYLKEFREVLKDKYDVAFVPAVTSISFTSNFLARLSNSRVRIGVRSLDGKTNSSHYLFDRLISHDWRENEKTHIADRNLALLKPFGIITENKNIIIHSDDKDKSIAENFIKTLPGNENDPLIGLHVGAGKLQNRWNYLKFAGLIDLLVKEKNARIYLTEGGKDDATLINLINENTLNELNIFDKKGMGVLKELISHSNLFITNDTGPMHVASATGTAVISLFGPTNPYMWAPVGSNKKFIRKGADINSIPVNEVYESAIDLLV